MTAIREEQLYHARRHRLEQTDAIRRILGKLNFSHTSSLVLNNQKSRSCYSTGAGSFQAWNPASTQGKPLRDSCRTGKTVPLLFHTVFVCHAVSWTPSPLADTMAGEVWSASSKRILPWVITASCESKTASRGFASTNSIIPKQ